MNFHVRLTIHSGGIGLRLLGGNCGVTGNHLGHHTAKGLDTQGQRRDVQKKNVLHLASKHTPLNRSTNSHNFVRVDGLIWIFARGPLDQFKNGWDTGGTTHHDYLIKFSGGQLGVFQRLLHGNPAAVDQVGSQLFKFGARQG